MKIISLFAKAYCRDCKEVMKNLQCLLQNLVNEHQWTSWKKTEGKVRLDDVAEVAKTYPYSDSRII